MENSQEELITVTLSFASYLLATGEKIKGCRPVEQTGGKNDWRCEFVFDRTPEVSEKEKKFLDNSALVDPRVFLKSVSKCKDRMSQARFSYGLPKYNYTGGGDDGKETN